MSTRADEPDVPLCPHMPQCYPRGCRMLQPSIIRMSLQPYSSLQPVPTVLEMHGQWLIVLLAGLFPSARGFGSVRQGCCFELQESVEDGGSSLTTWTRSFCHGQHMGGWDPYSISKADCPTGVFRDCSQVCAPPLHPRAPPRTSTRCVGGGPGGTASGCALGVGKADLRVASLSALCVNRRC